MWIELAKQERIKELGLSVCVCVSLELRDGNQDFVVQVIINAPMQKTKITTKRKEKKNEWKRNRVSRNRRLLSRWSAFSNRQISDDF